MTPIPKRVAARFIKYASKFATILKNASDRDINEADTVGIVANILSDVFGFDKFMEITREYAIRKTYCDLAVKVNEDVKYLIEVKSISTDLKEIHLRQALNYGATEGIKWVVLTNGRIWEVYNISTDKKVHAHKIIEIDFFSIDPRKQEDQEALFLLAKEGFQKDVIAEYQERMSFVNKYILSALILSDTLKKDIKRELRRLCPGLKIELDEIDTLLKNEVIKRNVLEDVEVEEAHKKVRKALARGSRIKNKDVEKNEP